jgi:hypothetical protein
MAHIPSYIRWWLGCDMVPAYRHHERVLKLLQWRCPPTRWHLKSPPDLCCLDAFARSIERTHRLDAPRPGEGSRKRLQAHLDRAWLPDRPRRRP